MMMMMQADKLPAFAVLSGVHWVFCRTWFEGCGWLLCMCMYGLSVLGVYRNWP